MNTPSNHAQSTFTANIAKDVILSIITCGLYNIFIQYRQIMAVNDMVGFQKYDFLKWLVLSIITCGIYHVYYEWEMAKDVVKARGLVDSHDPVVCLVVCCLSLPIIADAIIQSHINKHYGYVSV